MPHYEKDRLLQAAYHMYGGVAASPPAPEAEAKLALARALLDQAWAGGGADRGQMLLSEAGQVVRAALGDRWESSAARASKGLPSLTQVLQEDQCFSLSVSASGATQLRLRGGALVEQGERRQLARPGDEGRQWALAALAWASHPSLSAAAAAAKALAQAAAASGEAAAAASGAGAAATSSSSSSTATATAAAAGVPSSSAAAAGAGGGGGSSSSSSASAAPPTHTVQQAEPMALMAALLDAHWPVAASREGAAKNALARFVLEQAQREGGGGGEQLLRPGKRYAQLMSNCGAFLNSWWASGSEHHPHDPAVKPYKHLHALLEGDPCWGLETSRRGTQSAVLQVDKLLAVGAPALGAQLARVVNAAYPPHASPEAWLRGELGGWLLAAAARDDGAALRRALAVGPDAPTTFRIDLASAGEFLRRAWDHGGPYFGGAGAGPPPYTSAKQFLAAAPPPGAGFERHYVTVQPGQKPGQLHAALDVAGLLRDGPALLAAASTQPPPPPPVRAQPARPAASNGSSGSGGSGSAQQQAARPASGGTTAGRGADAAANSSSSSGSSSHAAAPAAVPPPQRVVAPAPPPRPQAESPAEAIMQAEADLAALRRLEYAPPPDMQWWWPEGRASRAGHVWTELAVRLIDPSDADAGTQLALLAQHLELSRFVGVACATYKTHVHLLSLLAPGVAAAGVDLPLTCYTIDIMRATSGVFELFGLIGPVLAGSQVLKVCHSSKQWSGQLKRAFGVTLGTYYDTQQANFVWNALRHAAGHTPHVTPQGVKQTTEVSLSSLLRANDLHHPIRSVAGADAPRLTWQDRPLREELITCAAADAAYLVPLMEAQVRNIAAAAADVCQQHTQAQQRGGAQRAAAVLGALPPELGQPRLLGMLALGAERTVGGGSSNSAISVQRLQEWAATGLFTQTALAANYTPLRAPGQPVPPVAR